MDLHKSPDENSSEVSAAEEALPQDGNTSSAAETYMPSNKEMRKDVIQLAWPSVTELVLISLMGLVDNIMVGRLGTYAITAVGLTNQPRLLFLATFVAMNVGATALIARFKGADNKEDANKVLRQNLALTLLLSIIVSAAGYFIIEPFLAWVGAGPDTLPYATSYMKIQLLGLISNTLALAITAALRGAGNTRASMFVNLTANVCNVFFNYGLIYGNFGMPALGVAGASLATVIGQVIGCVLAFCMVVGRHQYVSLRDPGSWKPDFPMIRRIVRIGIPSMIEQLVMRVGMTTFVRTVSSLGTAVFAAHQISLNILQLTFTNGQAFGIAATTLVGQSLGKGRPDLAKAYARQTQRLCMVLSIVLASCFILFGAQLAGLFTEDQTVIAMSVPILMMVAALQPFQNSYMVYAGALRGAGDTRSIAIITGIGIMLIRPGLAAFNVNVLSWGLTGAWVALVFDQLFRFAFGLVRFRRGKWVNIKV